MVPGSIEHVPGILVAPKLSDNGVETHHKQMCVLTADFDHQGVNLSIAAYDQTVAPDSIL